MLKINHQKLYLTSSNVQIMSSSFSNQIAVITRTHTFHLLNCCDKWFWMSDKCNL